MLHTQFKAKFLMAVVQRSTKQDLVPPEEFDCIAHTTWGYDTVDLQDGECNKELKSELLYSGKISFLQYMGRQQERYPGLKENSGAWYIDAALLSFEPLHQERKPS